MQSDDPITFLKSNTSFHNTKDYYLQSTGPSCFLLVQTDDRVEPAPECKVSKEVACQPTIYVAFKNAAGGGLTGFAPNSLANFFQDTVPWGSEFAEGKCPQLLLPNRPTQHCGLAAWLAGVRLQVAALHVAELVPFQSLFNFLGQGYRVVLCGFQFGGMVANAVAARLLLQLRQEIQLAKQMGINLSALSQTEDKASAGGGGPGRVYVCATS